MDCRCGARCQADKQWRGIIRLFRCPNTEARKYSALPTLQSQNYRWTTCFECKRNIRKLIKCDKVIKVMTHAQSAMDFGLIMYAENCITRYIILRTTRADIFVSLREMPTFVEQELNFCKHRTTRPGHRGDSDDQNIFYPVILYTAALFFIAYSKLICLKPGLYEKERGKVEAE